MVGATIVTVALASPATAVGVPGVPGAAAAPAVIGSEAVDPAEVPVAFWAYAVKV